MTAIQSAGIEESPEAVSPRWLLARAAHSAPGRVYLVGIPVIVLMVVLAALDANGQASLWRAWFPVVAHVVGAAAAFAGARETSGRTRSVRALLALALVCASLVLMAERLHVIPPEVALRIGVVGAVPALAALAVWLRGRLSGQAALALCLDAMTVYCATAGLVMLVFGAALLRISRLEGVTLVGYPAIILALAALGLFAAIATATPPRPRGVYATVLSTAVLGVGFAAWNVRALSMGLEPGTMPPHFTAFVTLLVGWGVATWEAPAAVEANAARRADALMRTIPLVAAGMASLGLAASELVADAGLQDAIALSLTLSLFLALIRQWIVLRERAALLAREQAARDSERRAHDALDRQSRVARVLGAVATAANQADTVEEAMQAAVDAVCAHTGWPVGHLYLAPADGAGDLVPTKVWHLEQPERFDTFRKVTEATRLAPGIGLPGHVFVSREPYWIRDVTQHANFPRARVAADIGVRAAFAFPVMVGSNVAAVLEFFAPAIVDPDPALLEVMGLVGIEVGRVMERIQANEALVASEERTRQVIETATDAYVGMDERGRIIDWNRQAEQMFGWSSEEALGRLVAETIVPPALRRAHETGLSHFLATGDGRVLGRRIELSAVRRNGEEFPIEITVWATTSGGSAKFNAFVHDITQRKALEEQLKRQAFHDSLTTLANRALFIDRVEHALARRGAVEGSIAVLFLDLDDFKAVNDRLGHPAGDEMLTEIGRRLQRCVRPADTVARFGGDEFAVLLEDLTDGASPVGVGERILAAMRTPIVIQGHEVSTGASLGIAVNGAAYQSAEELVLNADMAMYRAKSAGRGRYVVFEPTMRDAVLQRLEIRTDLQTALERHEFRLRYQPIVELATGRIVAVEALIRWAHGRRLWLPGEFIPVAEETGLIVPIGRWVVREACREAARWGQGPDGVGVGVTVNLSARQLQQTDLVSTVADALRDAKLAPSRLTLEITESVLIGDPDQVSQRLRSLKELGVRLAIDDFGTGYSSLSYLARFPIDILKIDKMFVQTLGEVSAEAPIARLIVDLGEALRLDLVAEGVELAEQVTALQALGCRFGQGYHFARPLNAESIRRLVANGAQMAIPAPAAIRSTARSAVPGLRTPANRTGQAPTIAR